MDKQSNLIRTINEIEIWQVRFEQPFWFDLWLYPHQLFDNSILNSYRMENNLLLTSFVILLTVNHLTCSSFFLWFEFFRFITLIWYFFDIKKMPQILLTIRFFWNSLKSRDLSHLFIHRLLIITISAVFLSNIDAPLLL